MELEIKTLRQCSWNNAEHTSFTGIVVFEGSEEELPYTFLQSEWTDRWDEIISMTSISAYVPPPPPPTVKSKDDVFADFTDSEFETFDTALTGATAKIRVLWNGLIEIRSDSSNYPTILAFFTNTFGAARAKQLLTEP